MWIDTCCIDKTSSAELSEAINSMFVWYQRSAECYVFLEDVSGNLLEEFGSVGADRVVSLFPDVVKLFCQSRWFTRGWITYYTVALRRSLL